MKLTRIIAAAALAALTALVSCEQQEDLGAASLTVGATEIAFEAAENSQPVTFTATRDWTATVSKDAQSWLTVSPASGSASAKEQTLTVEVMENTGYDRSGTVTVNLLSGTLTLDSRTVTVTQKGPGGSNTHDGTKDSPYTVEEALKIINDGEASENEVFVAGVITAIDATDAPGNSYGNATFWIADDAEAGESLEIYRAYGLGGERITTSDYIKEGDKVIMAGVLVLFKSTPEMTQGGYIYSLNGTVKEKGGGSGSGETKDPVVATVAEFLAAAESSTQPYKLTGTIGGTINTTYGNFDLTDDTGTVYVYGLTATNLGYGTKNDQSYASLGLAAGDKITLIGFRGSFNGKDEVVYAYFVEKVSGGGSGSGNDDPGTPAGDGTLASPYNPKAASDVAAALESGAKTDGDVYVAGKISSIQYTFDVEHGTATFYISEGGTTSGTQFYCYSVYYLGNRAWEDGDTQVVVGDEVIICGKLKNYNGTPETASREAYIYSLNGQTEIAQDNVFGVGSSTAVNVSASATSATIKVTGNVAWTASCDNDAFTLDKTSGEGAGEITVTFAANEDTENARVANITVSTTADVATKSYTVVLTQAKASAAGTREVEFVAGTDKTESTEAGHEVLTKDGVTLDVSNGCLYRTDNYRVYKNQTLTVSVDSGNITQVVFTCTAQGEAQYGPGCFTAPTSGSYAFEGNTGTWTGEASSFSLTASTNQVRATKIVVTVAE